jgi:hypothetical protein
LGLCSCIQKTTTYSVLGYHPECESSATYRRNLAGGACCCDPLQHRHCVLHAL